MHRPVMNPTFEALDQAPPRRSLGRLLLAVLQGIVSLLLWDVFRCRRGDRLRIEDASPLVILVRNLLYRMAFLPILIVGTALAVVVISTHPPAVPSKLDPRSVGIYHDPVSYIAADEARLEGWLVPVITARMVVEEQGAVLHARHPAVVLVHDFGASRDQLLPLVRPLHEAGFVVLITSLRGDDVRRNGQTLGLNESLDVNAAVDVLRRRPFVRGDAIAVLGTGTGATAALLAADRDPNIAALVLDNPVQGPSEAIARVGPTQPWLEWMYPICKWSFELLYKVDAEDWNLGRFNRTLASRPSLVLDNSDGSSSCLKPRVVGQIVDFLQTHLQQDPPAVARVPHE